MWQKLFVDHQRLYASGETCQGRRLGTHSLRPMSQTMYRPYETHETRDSARRCCTLGATIQYGTLLESLDRQHNASPPGVTCRTHAKELLISTVETLLCSPASPAWQSRMSHGHSLPHRDVHGSLRHVLLPACHEVMGYRSDPVSTRRSD